MAFTDYEHEVVSVIGFSFGLLGLVCSVLTLVLIYTIKRWNGYLLILTSMTVCQLFYDINYSLRIINRDAVCYTTMFLGTFGGLGASLWTNILAFSVTYTVLHCRSINIFRHYATFSLLGFLLPLIAAVYTVAYPGAISVDDDGSSECRYQENAQGNAAYVIYYWGRFCSVVVTFFFCVVSIWKIRQMRIGRTWINRDRLPMDAESSAILSTVMRMNYYAIAQAVCRSGSAWNEWDYGRYKCFESAVMAAVCSPLTATCNFIIFLLMQPNAFAHLKALLCCQSMPEETPSGEQTKSVDLRTFSTSSTDYNSSSFNPASRSSALDNYHENDDDEKRLFSTDNPLFYFDQSRGTLDLDEDNKNDSLNLS